MEKVNPIAVDKLMAQTRELAANYYQTTQQSLPVGSELAKYDAIRLLNLVEAPAGMKGVDAVQDQRRFQIKSRVCFNLTNSSYRLGQLNFEGEWDETLLVLMNAQYHPIAIYSATRSQLQSAIEENPNPNRSKRGIISVSKFKAIGTCVWTEA